MRQNYIACLTRMLIHSGNAHMTTCNGEAPIVGSHCKHCEYWIGNQPIDEEPEETSCFD